MSGLYEVSERVCKELPEGYEIKINLEKGAGGVVLETPTETIYIDCPEGLEEGVIEALEMALSEDKES